MVRLLFLGLLVQLSLLQTAKAQNLDNIRNAFSEGGPLVSCWNVNGGWNLDQQVKWIRAGHHYYPTIYVPLESQGANKPKKWNAWYAKYKDDLKYINDHRLPVTLRWHNWLTPFVEKDGLYRVSARRWRTGVLVCRRMADGSLDDSPKVDCFGPIEPWETEGRQIATTYWLKRLAEVLPDVPRLYFLENNEVERDRIDGNYVLRLDTTDRWGYAHRVWKTDLGRISLRIAEYAASHSVAEAEVEIQRQWKEKYDALQTSLLAAAPAPWSGKIYFGAYGMEMLDFARRGDGGETWSYERPQAMWHEQRWHPAIHRLTDPSDRIYDDGAGDADTWHDCVRGQALLQQNVAPLLRELEQRPLWHDDLSFWVSPSRCRMAANGHGGYMLPDRVKGFARACLWAAKPKGKATCLRWYAGSTVQLSDPWFTKSVDPKDVLRFTQADYFHSAMEAVDEVWSDPVLLKFWREGEAVLNPDPAFCDWTLPPDVMDDRSRTLYTNADPPRFQNGIDVWRATGGKMELRVFAQAYRAGSEVLVYAWSPRRSRSNVTVHVPGVGEVLFNSVDQDGEWRLASSHAAID